MPQTFTMGKAVKIVRLPDGPQVERMKAIIAYLEKEMLPLSHYQIGCITGLVNDWSLLNRPVS